MNSTVQSSVFDSTFHGEPGRPAIIIVGVWDPFASGYRALLSRLVAEAHARHLAAVTVLLDPAPVQFLATMNTWPIFEPAAVRIERMRQLGVDGTVVVHFTRSHLTTSPALFMESIRAHIPIAELWLGVNQVFGRGESGSQEAIFRVGRSQGFGVRLLDGATDPKGMSFGLRARLASGCVAAARELVGHVPVHARPTGAPLRLAWAPGCYQGQPLSALEEPLDTMRVVPVMLEEEEDGCSTLVWPDPRMAYLAMLKGPNDVG